MNAVDIFEKALGVAGIIAAIIFGYIVFFRESKNSEKEEGKKSGTVLTEIGYIKANTDDIKRRQEKFEDNHLQVAERLSATEQSVKSAHHRIDNIEERIPDGH